MVLIFGLPLPIPICPFGTLLFSLLFIGYFAQYLYLDLKGIKDRKERLRDKKEKAACKALYDCNPKKKWKPKPKPRFKPNWRAFWRLAFEGLLFGSFIFIIIRFIAYDTTLFLMEGEVHMPYPIDKDPHFYATHSNIIQDIAPGFWCGLL